MEKLEFDERYPAIFQPGGDGLPRTVQRPAAPTPDTVPPATASPGSAPLAVRAPIVASAPIVVRSPDAVRAPDAVRLPAVSMAPAREQRAAVPAAAEANEPPEPAAGSTVGTGQLPPVEHLAGTRHTHWSARSWILGVGAALLTVAAGMVCLFAEQLFAPHRVLDVGVGSSLAVTPWISVVVGAAHSLIIAGMGMLAAILLLGSRHYVAASHWLRAGVVLVGLVALTGAYLAVFASILFPEIIYGQTGDYGGVSNSSWSLLTFFAGPPLTVFALTVLAVVAVVRPGGSRAKGAVSGPAALGAGALLIVGAAVASFAPQLFPGSLNGTSVRVDDQNLSILPWPYVLTGIGSSIAVVGAGVFLWGVLVMVTSRRVFDDEIPNDERRNGEVHNVVGAP
ncbi:MAG: hypothetical protein WBX27_02030 [Specibacter sp.]